MNSDATAPIRQLVRLFLRNSKQIKIGRIVFLQIAAMSKVPSTLRIKSLASGTLDVSSNTDNDAPGGDHVDRAGRSNCGLLRSLKASEASW